MTFLERLKFLRIIVLLQLAALFSLLFLTNLNWSSGELFAMACIAAALAFAGLLLSSTKCPRCEKPFFFENEAEAKTKQGLLKALRVRKCAACGFPEMREVDGSA